MPYLEIDGKQLEARTDFKFDRVANEKYNEPDAKGNTLGGLMNIYMNLLEYDTGYLLAFWDCALSHLKKDKPALDKIEEALMERIEQDGDTEKLFKEAFSKLDTSGFFKKKVKSFWKDFEAMGKVGNKEEQKQNKEMLDRMKQRRNELTA
ncbi:tail assembly chaperone [Virgibacillus sp. Bac332]|uniref:tail assembly chaperone n=1 Tax=Virgibacillus sp. Bac332 TaxID=2419842 RepID=UPI000EF45C2D|nr:tail assembly chaperone [Virgibacillus sp. Bac332]